MIYLDAAATTLQKPPAVAKAAGEAVLALSSPGRGGYPSAQRAADVAFACRTELAELFHIGNPERVVFTHNATHGLNIAIKSLISPGDRVVISGYEHNAVTRPLAALHADTVTVAGELFHSEAVTESFEPLLTPETAAVICNHVSNVFGFVQPVEEIAALCRARGIPLIVDASQSAGVIPLDMDALGAAYLAMPGHKGLYGPQGTGVLLCGEGVQPKPLLEGGTGTQSLLQEMPDFLPDRLEAGTHNMPGIAGLLAGIRYVRERGERNICRRERQLALMAAELLRELPGIRVYAAPGLRDQIGVLSFTVEGWDCETLAEKLAEADIALRAGLHCSPLAHRTAGTLATGTLRVSFSDFSTPQDVGRFFEEVKRLIS